MAFETGFAANEFQLQEKLHAFLLSNGWALHSRIDTFDCVYRAGGEDGYKDIYIRSKCSCVDPPVGRYGRQQDFGDGYTGYLNFFAYQYYPEDGDGYGGYGEAGRFGPRFWYWRGNDQLYYVHAGDSDVGVTWQRIVTEGTISGGNKAFYSRFGFDGLYRMWNEGTTFNNSLITSWIGSEINELTDIAFYNMTQGGSSFPASMVFWVDPNTRKEYLWHQSSITSSTVNKMKALAYNRTNLETGFLETGWPRPEWSDVGSGRIYSYNGDMIWDGHNHLYSIRNESHSSGTDTNEWAKYHIPSNTWTVLSPNLPEVISDADEARILWVDKSISGFNNHRIYRVRQTSSLIDYIDIDENNGLPIGAWTSAGATPLAPSGDSFFFHNNHNRFFWGAQGQGQDMYYAEMTSGTLSWNLINTTWLQPAPSSGRHPEVLYVDGYASRVRTSLYDKTQYWFIANQDRLIVATNSDDQDTFCYMGAISPYSSSTPKASTTAKAFAGTSEEIQINLEQGEFVVGEKYYIVDVTDEGGGEITNDIEGVTRKFKPGEQFTVTSSNPGVSITVDEIKNNYPIGARIGKDPQPVGITLEGSDKIQMLNYINTESTDQSGSYDMSKSIYNMKTIDTTLVSHSGGDARRNFYMLWPISAVKDDTENFRCGNDIRGSLIGVFAVAAEGDIKPGDTVTAGTNAFLVLNPPSSYKVVDTSREPSTSSPAYFYAVGPLD